MAELGAERLEKGHPGGCKSRSKACPQVEEAGGKPLGLRPMDMRVRVITSFFADLDDEGKYKATG